MKKWTEAYKERGSFYSSGKAQVKFQKHGLEMLREFI